jgi:hypothetical protein
VNATVPGLAIVPDPDDPGSLLVVHESSGLRVVQDCAGEGCAETAMIWLAGVTDWTAGWHAIVDAMAADPSLIAGMERAAIRAGAALIKGERLTAA